MMNRFRRIFKRHPNDDEETPLVPKEKKKSIGQRVTSAIRKRLMKRKGYTEVDSARGEGRRRRKRAVKAMSSIRGAIRRRKKAKRPRKTHK